MAESNSIDPGNPVLQGATAGSQAVLNQTQGVGGGNVNSVPGASLDTSGTDATVTALLKLGSDVLAPKIKEAQSAQFFEGVMQAAQGEALTDIVKNKPEFTQIFGPTASVLGARTYTTAAKVAQFGTDMANQMPMLAQQGPEALKAAMQESLKSNLTGDPLADQAITMAYVDQMVPLTKQHAAANYEYNQYKAVDDQAKAWTGNATRLQQSGAAAAKGQLTAEDMKAEVDKFMHSFGPFGDQTDKSFEKNVTQFLANQAELGNFQVIKALKANGVYDAVPADKRTQLDHALAVGGRKALDTLMADPAYGLQVAMFVNDTAQDPRQIATRAAALNAKAAQQTGVTEAKLIPDSMIDNITGKVLVAQATAGRAATDDSAKVALAAAAMETPGALAKALAMGLTDDKSSEKASIAKFAAIRNDPQKAADWLNKAPGVMFNGIREDLQLPLNTEVYNQGINQTALTYSKLAPELQGKYFSEKQQQTLDRFNSLVKTGSPPEAAWLTATKTMPLADFSIPDKEKGDVQKGIRSWVEKQHENFVGWNNVDDSGLRALEAMTMQTYKRQRILATPEVAIARSLSQVEQLGAQVIGKHVAIGITGQVPLVSMLAKKDSDGYSSGIKETTDAFEELMKDKAKAVGGTLANTNIVRGADYKGDARFMVESYDEKGGAWRWTIMGKEVRDLARNKAHTKVAEDVKQAAAIKAYADGTPQTQLVDTGFGPTIVPR